MGRPGPVIEFHAYGQQDGHKHDEEDAREALAATANDVGGAIAATRELFRLWNENARWRDAKPIVECMFTLDVNHRASSAGEAFRKQVSN
jgi:hypothetical protein